MPKDHRQRNVKGHATAESKPLVVEWASPKQEEIFWYGPFPQCASGGFGSAKTFSFCLKALHLSVTYPNNRGMIGRKEFEMLKHTTMSTFYKICPPGLYNNGGKRSDSEKYLRLNNGSEILWMHMDDPETENVIRGLEINWFMIDQAEESEEELFDLLMTRLGRWDKAEVPESVLALFGGIEAWPWKNPMGKALVPTYPMLACNPDTELHWIYRRFHPDSPEYQQKYKALGYKMWTMSSDENRFLPRQNLDLMLQKDESFVRRFVRGEWGIPEGQIHKIDPLSILTTDPEDEGHPERGVYIPDAYEYIEYLRATSILHRSFDYGDSAPTVCGWEAVDREGNSIFYREYYQGGKTPAGEDVFVSHHRANITEMSRISAEAFERYQFQLADPSIFFKTQQKYGGRWSNADEYSDVKNLPKETAIFWQPADNNEMGTRNRINEYLRVDPERIHPITKQKGSPRIFFLKRSEAYPEGCYHIIRETRSQRRMKVGTDMGRPIFSDERDDKIPDHGYDVVRYHCASRPPVAKVPEGRYSRHTFANVRKEAIRFKKAGGFRLLAREAARRAAMN